MASFDGVVIGAGHNGLTVAPTCARRNENRGARAQRAHRRRLQHRQRPVPRSPVQFARQFLHGISRCPLIEDLELYRFGFSYIEPSVQQAAVFATAPASSSTRISKRPAPRWRGSPSRMPKRSANCGRPTGRDAAAARLAALQRADAAQATARSAERAEGKELLSHAQHDLFSVVRKHFVDERIQTLFTSYMHVITTENVAGAGIVFPAMFANIASFTLPVGGAVSLVECADTGSGSRRRGSHQRRRRGSDRGQKRSRYRRTLAEAG